MGPVATWTMPCKDIYANQEWGAWFLDGSSNVLLRSLSIQYAEGIVPGLENTQKNTSTSLPSRNSYLIDKTGE